jgi:hypothetical protein
MINSKHGEAILLYWETEPEAYYVKGHVSWIEAMHALALEYGRGSHYVGRRDHVYARWSQEAACKSFDVDAILREYPTPGRGRFPVTAIRRWVPSE